MGFEAEGSESSWKRSEMNLDKNWGSQGSRNIGKSNPEDNSVYLYMLNIYAGNVQGDITFIWDKRERHTLSIWIYPT